MFRPQAGIKSHWLHMCSPSHDARWRIRAQSRRFQWEDTTVVQRISRALSDFRAWRIVRALRSWQIFLLSLLLAIEDYTAKWPSNSQPSFPYHVQRALVLLISCFWIQKWMASSLSRDTPWQSGSDGYPDLGGTNILHRASAGAAMLAYQSGYPWPCSSEWCINWLGGGVVRGKVFAPAAAKPCLSSQCLVE